MGKLNKTDMKRQLIFLIFIILVITNSNAQSAKDIDSLKAVLLKEVSVVVNGNMDNISKKIDMLNQEIIQIKQQSNKLSDEAIIDHTESVKKEILENTHQAIEHKSEQMLSQTEQMLIKANKESFEELSQLIEEAGKAINEQTQILINKSIENWAKNTTEDNNQTDIYRNIDDKINSEISALRDSLSEQNEIIEALKKRIETLEEDKTAN